MLQKCLVHALLCFGFCLISACAAKTPETAPLVVHAGALPVSGTVVIRSGLSQTSETSQLFAGLQRALASALATKGLKVVNAPASSLSMAGLTGNRYTAPDGPARQAVQQPRSGNAGQKNAQPQKLRLARYTIPTNDADLPESVMRVTPPDSQALLFARSQQSGRPTLVRAGAIPGVIPNETLATDPKLAEYTLICRFAEASTDGLAALSKPADLVTASGNKARSLHSDNSGTILVAAELIRGVSRMGYGAASRAAPPRPTYGSSPYDYRRGYVGNSPYPGDPWHRDADFKARNYMLRHGPAPEDASPPAQYPHQPLKTPRLPSTPKPPLPGDNDYGPTAPRSYRGVRPGSGLSPNGSYPGVGGSAHYAAIPLRFGGIPCYGLELELYAHRTGAQGPIPIWKSIVWQEATAASLAAALPELVQLAFYMNSAQ
ncbi:hypothetical protein LJC46_06570 [Desulfovibrio sp. OttesenSCG-928-G15]|nr:hypothetical protein [Desulfovibrio sp. OttesenSCG-928-G15]